MARVSQVEENIYEIHPELNFMFSLSYLVLGERAALIDPGSATQADIVLRAIEEILDFDLDSLSYIIPTHLHIDHAGGVGHLARRFPQVRIPVYERHIRYAIDPARLIDGNKQTFGENFADKFGTILPVPEEQIIAVDGGDTIDLGGRQLKVVYSRGHANHHFCLHDDKSGGLFCGDALGMYYPEVDGVVIICPEGFDLNLSLQTIEQLRSLAPQVLFYAHEGTGRETDDLMRRAAVELRDCGDIILAALKTGEGSKQIEERLNQYFKENVSKELKYEYMYLDLTVAGYRRYFQKCGEIQLSGGTN
ncbi:MAG: MBL fold metallo-hydrolase [Chloroflexi bacterium]|nr:MBL fold metallo-hydrolase [Chloroflexota bacterium]